jgi:hypothetical protein
MSELVCDLLLDALPDGDRRVSFSIRNDGPEPAEVTWFEPFVTFELAAEIGGEPVRVISGPYDGGIQPMHDVLAASEEHVIATPVTLAFDAGPALPNPGPPTRWRIAHEPADTVLRATVTLGSRRLSCEAELHPVSDLHG